MVMTDNDDDQRVITPEAEKYNATLVKREDDNGDLARFWVRADGEAAHFEPGQYMTIGVIADGKMLQRPYSVASAPVSRTDGADTGRSSDARICSVRSGILRSSVASRRSCSLIVYAGSSSSVAWAWWIMRSWSCSSSHRMWPRSFWISSKSCVI